MDQFAYQSVNQLSKLIREKEISPVELVDATIKRINERNEATNSFVYLAFDEARERAKIAEKQVLDGEELGLLHGIPTAIKDLFDFKPGWPSTFGGIPALKDNIADFHCVYAERIERAGTIIIGSTFAPKNNRITLEVTELKTNNLCCK